MFFWHIGLSISFFRYVFKDFSADLRFLITGVILPEIIYISLKLMNFSELYSQIGHTLLFAIFLLIFVMIFTKRNTKLRRNFLLIAIGVFFHLLFDVMGTSTTGILGSFFNYLSMRVHFDSISRGVVDSRDLVYYGSLTTIGLYLAELMLSKRNWQS